MNTNIEDMKDINVLNYNSFSVTVSTKDGSILISGTLDEPTIYQLTPMDIKQINNSSRAFKDGLLFFDEDLEQEIYENWLRIPKWKDILKNSEIKEILLNPTTRGLSQIIENESPMFFNRVMSIYTSLKNMGEDGVSYKVVQVLEKRRLEIQNKNYKTKIELSSKNLNKNKKSSSENDSKIENLKQENNELQNLMKEQNAQILEMQKQMAELMKQSQIESKHESVSGNVKDTLDIEPKSLAKKSTKLTN